MTEPLVLLSPTELAALADKYWEARTKRLAADKVASALKAEESAAEATLVQQMLAGQNFAVGGKTVTLTLPRVPDYVPAVRDWDAVYAHILETKDFSLLHKRIGESAVKERWQADVEVPGVEKFPVYKLSKSGVK